MEGGREKRGFDQKQQASRVCVRGCLEEGRGSTPPEWDALQQCWGAVEREEGEGMSGCPAVPQARGPELEPLAPARVRAAHTQAAGAPHLHLSMALQCDRRFPARGHGEGRTSFLLLLLICCFCLSS